MLGRREFLAFAAAVAASLGMPGLARGQRQAIDQEALLGFRPLGQVTLLHFTDLHAQLVPLHFREAAVNIGLGDLADRPPRLAGRRLIERLGLAPDSLEAYLLGSDNFADLAKSFGPIGGLDRLATLVAAIRAERAERVLLFDGGDSFQGAYTTLASAGADLLQALNLLRLDGMTGHWEFTLGEARWREIVDALNCPFLAGNVRERDFEDPVFEASRVFERGGLAIGVIGQAFPYTPIANPAWLIPNWTFGIRHEALRQEVARLRQAKVDLVVLLSHNGFDVDHKLARLVPGIDVILSGHTHDALLEPAVVGQTLIVASGSHGKFLSRLDLDMRGGRIAEWRYRLIPVLAQAIAPDPGMAKAIAELRAPHAARLAEPVARTETLLYRRGNFNGTADDLICDALLAELDAEIAFSPGFRWGATLLPGQDITLEDVYSLTAISYPGTTRRQLSGRQIKAILEDVADNLFNPDPFYRQGGDMVRTGGLGFRIRPAAPIGQRIDELRLLAKDEPLAADKSYWVAGWAQVAEPAAGEPVYDVLLRYLRRQGTVRVEERRAVRMAV
ncbi:MAG: thiosulfohydrolase SoxB [Alphaproteobacteria bacterium]|nr:thiosulfohydrolase SoxB [Alphaproteobacteria bacterium]